MMRCTLFVFLTTLCTACGPEEPAFDTGNGFGGAALDPGGDQLRVDVYPSNMTPDVMAQTWVAPVDADWANLDVEISPPITVQGTVIGYKSTPFGAEIPGQAAAPIEANVELIRPGTINAIRLQTDELGFFETQIAPARGYRLSIVPNDTTTIAIHIEADLSLIENTDFEEIDIGLGEPVFGNVYLEDTDPISGLDVRIEDPETGITGTPTSTNENGHFLLRAREGEVNVLFGGNLGSTFPTRREIATAGAEQDAALSVDFGQINPVQIAGQVFNFDGDSRQKDIKVRLISMDLSQTEGDLVVETETDGDGWFSRAILPGEWVVEFIPPFDSDLGPLTEAISVPIDSAPQITLDATYLPNRIRVVETVRDALGKPVPYAALNAVELGFDAYVYSATANSEGEILLDLPPTPLAFMIIPPSGKSAITHFEANPGIERLDLRFTNGDRIAGLVRNGNAVVPFAYIELRDAVGNLYGNTLSGSDGRFTIRVENLPNE